MMRLAGAVPLLVLTLGLLPATRAPAQAIYAAAGAGPTPVLDGHSANRNLFGMVGYRGPRSLGGRVSGSETVSRLWLSADLMFEPGPRGRAVRPYLLAGAGVVVDLRQSDPLLSAGAGVRGRLSRLVFAFLEARVHAIPGSSTGPGVIVPLTFGVGLGR
ncbi:MAG TPA: hypothetical protein VF046_08035 [Gemmatimonadales bacterium]